MPATPIRPIARIEEVEVSGTGVKRNIEPEPLVLKKLSRICPPSLRRALYGKLKGSITFEPMYVLMLVNGSTTPLVHSPSPELLWTRTVPWLLNVEAKQSSQGNQASVVPEVKIK